jgi:hypothetical protein
MKAGTFNFLAAGVAMVLATRALPQNPPTAVGEVQPPAPASGVPRVATYQVPVAETVGAKAEVPVDVPSLAVRKMAPFQVIESRVYYFRERDINTPEGMAALSFKRHPGLLIGKAFRSNKSAAYEIFMKDDWRATKSDYWDMAHAMAQGGDPAEGRMILEAINNEDLRMRGEADGGSSSPVSGRFQLASMDTSTHLLQAPEVPVNIAFVKMTW